jgi:hypothetical protein
MGSTEILIVFIAGVSSQLQRELGVCQIWHSFGDEESNLWLCRELRYKPFSICALTKKPSGLKDT